MTHEIARDLLQNPEYGYDPTSNMIKREKFHAYLGDLESGLLEEITFEILDRIFMKTQEKYYVLTELMVYFSQMISPELN